ncbi:MAG: ubiquinone/menaquinone biosynthesis methyltransferase [Planctomycetota bacterium]
MPAGPVIQRMFAEVADGYDRANRVLSLGIDVLWRRRAIAAAGLRAGERVLDVCAGTGDLAIAMARRGARVVGADFCAPMLVHAHRKGGAAAGRPAFLCGDAMRLPFADGGFDLATVAFGIRNVEDPVAAMAEMARVVRPGGRVVVLEFCRPRVPVLGRAYLFYFRRVLPRLGRWISGADNGAYQYLPDSVMAFPERAEFLELMQRAGLRAPSTTLLSGGIAAIYRGEVAR